MGSSLPRSDSVGVYDLLVGLTGLFGKRERNFWLMFGALLDFGGAVTRAAGAGVGRISTGRDGAGTRFAALPAFGPGDGPPLGPGLGAVPAVFATAAAARVGLGLGTPARWAGATEARAAGAALALGAGLARAMAAAVGEAFGNAGAGVTTLVLGLTTGAGGLGDGRADGATVGAGEGATVGGGLTATAIGATVGTLTGAAGSSLWGCVSKIFCVG